MSDDSEISMSVPAPANQTICSNCHSTMPSELRFCRNCGFRLTGSMGGYTAAQYPDVTTTGPAATGKRKRRMSGMSWLFVGLLIFFVCAAAFTALIAPMRKSGNIGFVSTPVVKSYIGVDGFDDTDQGVIIKSVAAPDGPADKAGLIGGDVI